MFAPAMVRRREKGEAFLVAVGRSAMRARRRFGGYIVHLGVVVVIVAISGSSAFKVHRAGTIRAGETLPFGAYQLRLDDLRRGVEPHRSFIAAHLTVLNGKDGSVISEVSPRMNFYPASTDPVGTPAIVTFPDKDLYISLLAFSEQEKSASFNVWIFPLVAWIWWSLPLLVGGSLFAAWPSRRSKKGDPTVSELPTPSAGSDPGQRGAA
jgi:cytochrome c-type biogenesis protein CcmF